MTRLLHYSNTVVKLEPHDYGFGRDTLANMKPRGFWVTVPGYSGWKEWCESEEFRLDRLAYEHEVTFTPNANILHINGPEELDAFHEEYSEAEAKMPEFFGGDRYRLINWERLHAEGYDGILIVPYLWSHRLEGPMWYYGWDVASGCIWNVDVIRLKWRYPPLLELQRRADQYIDIAFEQALNRLKFGTSDPTGGAGRQLYPINHPLFPETPEEGE